MTVLNRRTCAVLSAVALLTMAGWAPAAAGSTATQRLLSQASQNTNSVRTITYTILKDERSTNLSFKLVDHGAEDEVANSEQHHMSAVVHEKIASGRMRTIKYTVDLIFIHGRTYYRSNLFKNNAWQERIGSVLHDPVLAGNGWQRKRTAVSFPLSNKYAEVSRGGQVHLRSQARTSIGNTTEDVYVTQSIRPYVARMTVNVTGSFQGNAVSIHQDTTFGGFNRPLHIDIPTTGV
ncbi:MAG: hypothetical protein ACR2JC_07240 [Chloroflexota bacterium]